MQVEPRCRRKRCVWRSSDHTILARFVALVGGSWVAVVGLVNYSSIRDVREQQVHRDDETILPLCHRPCNVLFPGVASLSIDDVHRRWRVSILFEIMSEFDC